LRSLKNNGLNKANASTANFTTSQYNDVPATQLTSSSDERLAIAWAAKALLNALKRHSDVKETHNGVHLQSYWMDALRRYGEPSTTSSTPRTNDDLRAAVNVALNDDLRATVNAALVALHERGPDIAGNLQTASRQILDDLPPSSDPEYSDTLSEISDVHVLPEVTDSSDDESNWNAEPQVLEASSSDDE
ncbi:hypothetical protein H0H92_014301, partial [Tricholoma furcatifolium]